MAAPAKRRAEALDLDPREAASRVVDAHAGNAEWLDAFAAELDRRRAASSLARTLAVWQLSQSEAARLFGVSRQAVSKWLEQGVPADRVEVVADLAAATDLLLHYLKRDRVPAVVRRAVPALGGRSLLDLLGTGRSRELLETCRGMFAFDRAQGGP
jgi:DNA-binding XRE family transcriptional regulator